MPTTTFRDLPNEEDNTLFLVMDGDNNLTGDPKTIDRIMERRETTELRIIRLLANSADSDECDSDDEDGRPKVKLTVQEILPENAEDDGKTGDSTVPPDFVDPFSQMDTEQMLQLKKALASEQAKQILGDNVTAMLDVLSVDESPTAFLQNSIKRDHCYTPLSPSADPKGASFVMSPPHPTEVKRPKGRPPKDASRPSGSGVTTQPKPPPSAVVTQAANSDNEDVEEGDEEEYEESSEASDSDRSSDSDYRDRNSGASVRGRRRGGRGWGGRRIRGGARGGFRRGRGRPSRREAVVTDPDSSNELDDSPVSKQVDTQAFVPGKRGRPKKHEGMKHASLSPVTPTAIPSTSVENVIVKTIPLQTAPTTAPAVPVDPTPIDHLAAKALSGDAIRLGRTGKTEEERRRDMARILKTLDVPGRKIIYVQKKAIVPPRPTVQTPAEEKVDTIVSPVTESSPAQKPQVKPVRTYARIDPILLQKEKKQDDKTVSNKVERVHISKTAVVTSPTPVATEKNVMGGKYPRRENRKLPSHLADAVVPELFSSPDVLRKKNVTSVAPEEVKAKPSSKGGQRSLLKFVKKAEPLPPTSPEVDPEALLRAVVEGTATEEIPSPPVALPDAVDELQTMLEEGLSEAVNPSPKVSEKITPAESIPESLPPTEIVKPSEPPPKNISIRRSSEKKPDVPKAKEAESAPTDISEIQASILHELPAESVDELLQSVVEKEENVVEEAKKSMGEYKAASSKRRTSQELKSESQSARRTSRELKLSSESLVKEETLDKDSPLDSSASAEERKRNAAKRRRSDEVSDLESDLDDTLSDASWNSEDDPDKLWCICRKPHNNRFMICCDACEEWFHGKCVGITKSIGKQMEQDGLEWSCPTCAKKKRTEEREKEEGKLPSKTEGKPGTPKFVQSKITGFTAKRLSKDEPSSSPRTCIMCKGPVRENSIYCSDECILKHSQKAIANLGTAAKNVEEKSSSTPQPQQRIVVMEPSSKTVLRGEAAPTASNLQTWLRENPSFHVLYSPGSKVRGPIIVKRDGNKLVQLVKRNPSEKSGQMRLAVSPNSKRVKIISRATGQTIGEKIITTASIKKPVGLPNKTEAAASPKPKSIDAVRTKAVESPKPQRRRKEKLQVLSDYKPPQVQTSRMDEGREKTTPGEQAIRESVRKTLGEALKARVADCKDLKSVDTDIDALVVKIEDRLYKHFESKVDVKYKSKYRSLVFNIKDQKNEIFFRKIVENSISPRELVKLSADEMASQELSQWREKEQQHQLEIIKKTELELLTHGQTIIMKSHKGEEVIGKDQKVAAAAAVIDPNTSAQELVSALNSVSSTTNDTAEANPKKKDTETSLMKMRKKEKERRRDKDRKHKRDRSHDRSRSSRHSKSRKRSRSRSHDRHRRKEKRDSRSRSSRHSKDSDKDKEKEKDKKDEVPEKKESPKEIVTPEEPESNLNTFVTDEADYEPTSTVTIKTPEPMSSDDTDLPPTPVEESVWNGNISMADVAKFEGKAFPASDESHGDLGIGAKLNVVGRIPYNTVWEYIARMKKLGTKDIILLEIVPLETDQDRSSFSTLYAYLSKRSRIGVIGRVSDQIKDFYLYPHEAAASPPAVLQSLSIPSTPNRNILLGIIVRSKRGRFVAATPAKPPPKVLPKPSSLPLPPASPPPSSTSTRPKLVPLPVSPPNVTPKSSTPPSSDSGTPSHRKRKIRVEIAKKAPEEDDSPYSPASSDEDLPPLSKTVKKTLSTKASADDALDEAAQIQKKIDEMNREIEEQTQQIKSLASAVPPITTTSLPINIFPPKTNVVVEETVMRAVDVASELESNLEIPLPPAVHPEEADKDAYSPTAPMTPPPVEDSVSVPSNLVLPEVAQISIPSNLQEILASIKQNKPPAETSIPLPPSEEVEKPPCSHTASPEPPPPGVDEEDEVLVLPTRPKPVETDVFESVGLPKFKGPKLFKSKPIKFELKTKSLDVDDRPSVVVEDPSPSVPQADSSSLVDKDDRVTPQTSEVALIDDLGRDRDYRMIRNRSRSRTPSRTPERRRKKSRSRSRSPDHHHRYGRRRSDNYRRTDKRRSRDDKTEAEWEGSIRDFEDDLRRRHRDIRAKEIKRLRRRSDSE